MSMKKIINFAKGTFKPIRKKAEGPAKIVFKETSYKYVYCPSAYGLNKSD